MGHITSRVVQSALAAPGVRFNFIKDGKRVMELPPAATLLERVRQVFGADYADNLVEIRYDDFDIKVAGLAGKPPFHRATAIDQYFFINRRPVKDALVRSAVARAFDDLVPRGRKPVVFLSLELPLALVDVNVHPAKAEVRLADPSKVSAAIVKGIRGAFGKSSSTPPAVTAAHQDFGDFRPSAPPGAGDASAGNREAFARAFELWRPPVLPGAGEGGQLNLQSAHGRLSPDAVAVGQLFGTFILFEEGDRLVIMDQHTVHERVLFERFMKRHLSSAIERQGLLVPTTLNVDPKMAAVLRSHLKTFSSLGWELEEFGQNAFVIRQVPAVLAGRDYARVALDIVETLGSNRDGDFKDVLADCVSRIACRAAVKAGDELGLGEMRDLARELASAELPYTCPHGRPIAFTISKDELKRYFSR
jgi:DNA mismatch repair protein MutL